MASFWHAFAVRQRVAPFMGAWIEILLPLVDSQENYVAPFMGAWIEIRCDSCSRRYGPGSHPSWVRGLKWICRLAWQGRRGVAPFMGAWIEIPKAISIFFVLLKSHPSWVRGLKYRVNCVIYLAAYESHPSWVRGLKSGHRHRQALNCRSRTLHGCVD